MYIWRRKKSELTEKSLVKLNRDPDIDFKKIRDSNGSRGGEEKWLLWITK